MTEWPIRRIKVGKRFRKDLGDLQGLAESIRTYSGPFFCAPAVKGMFLRNLISRVLCPQFCQWQQASLLLSARPSRPHSRTSFPAAPVSFK